MSFIKKHRKTITFFLTCSLLFIILSPRNIILNESLIFLLCVFCGYLFYENKKVTEKLSAAKTQTQSLNNYFSNFDTSLNDKFKKIEQKLDNYTQKKESSQKVTDLPYVNVSLVSAFDSNETYFLDNQVDDNSNPNSHKLLIKRLNSLLKRNGQTLKKLKPFNKKIFKELSSNSPACDDDLLNINFPTNLINSN